MSKCIVTIPANKYAKQQYEITKPHILAYSQLVGAELIELTDNLYPDHKEMQDSYGAMLNKYRVQFITKDFDQTLYLDCDIFPTKLAPNIFNRINIGDWGMVDEYAHIDEEDKITYSKQFKHIAELLGAPPPQKIPNAGMMLMPRDANYFHFKEAPDYWCLDQFVLACTVQPHWLPQQYNWGFIRSDWIEGLHRAYFIHLNGCNGSKRLKLLRETTEEFGL